MSEDFAITDFHSPDRGSPSTPSAGKGGYSGDR
jgi:hypothetical protein